MATDSPPFEIETPADLVGVEVGELDLSLPLLQNILSPPDLDEMQKLAAAWRADAKRVVVIAMGGSSLGGQVVAQVLGDSQLIFTETMDEDELQKLFSDVRDTRYLIISKSGETLEVLIKTKILLAALERAEVAAPDVVQVITQAGENSLRKLTASQNIPIWEHPADIGGRYSVFCNVGLFPCMLCGGDAAALLGGAKFILEEQAALTKTNAAAQLAAIKSHRPIAVLVAYTARLERFCAWHRQLWAESLGKQGQPIFAAPALAPADHHSQLQSYAQGADDKFFTLLTPPFAAGEYGRFKQAAAQAMGDELASLGRQVRRINLAALDERTLGALFMLFMLETILVADALGINPFDQPGVEAVKRRVRDLLGGEL